MHLLDALDALLVLKVPQARLAHLEFLVPLDTQASPARTVTLARKEPPDSPGALEPPGPQHKMVRSHRMCGGEGGGRCARVRGRGGATMYNAYGLEHIPSSQHHAGGKGQKGELGYPGAQGNPGAPGAPGERGMPGEKGSQGPSGPAGTPGTPGYPGSEGQKGEKGTPGLPGNNGIPGKSINCDIAACKNATCLYFMVCLYFIFIFIFKAPPDPKVPPAQLVLADPRALKVTLASVDHQDKEERKEHQAAQEHQDQKVKNTLPLSLFFFFPLFFVCLFVLCLSILYPHPFTLYSHLVHCMGSQYLPAAARVRRLQWSHRNNPQPIRLRRRIPLRP